MERSAANDEKQEIEPTAGQDVQIAGADGAYERCRMPSP
jgi:hypothetical protein